MSDGETIAFFTEAAYGPALNSIGIAQECEKLGHEPVFICDRSIEGVFEYYGFEEHYVHMSDPEIDTDWEAFINKHIPNFNKTPYESTDNYAKQTYQTIVGSAKWADKDPPDGLEEI